MIGKIKKTLYFPVASYFRFFAMIRLKRWNPRIVVITGSNGKTTLLNLLEAQFGNNAKYSHHANSSYGIPFDILDLHRKSLLKSEWIGLFIKTPFQVFKSLPREKIYIVEADCDRPGEGKFLASLLNPEVALWVSSAKTHSMNFENFVKGEKFETVEEAIAYEFGYFLKYAKKVVMIDGDSELMKNQLNRLKANVFEIKKVNILKRYAVSGNGTTFEMMDMKYSFKYLLPEEAYLSLEMCKKVVEYFELGFDQSFSKFVMPPGRGSIFKGIKGITIVDSSYNSNLTSARAVLSMFGRFPEKNKWIVIGDMLELGQSEKEEHEKLSEIINSYSFERIILMGPRVGKYTYPKLVQNSKFKTQNYEGKIDKFENPKETLDYLLKKIKGGEVILFKGARFMEGIIENLLLDKIDVDQLPRREKIWEIRRKQWGL